MRAEPGALDAHLEIRLYFSDREPIGPYREVVPARRTLHLRLNALKDPRVPRGTDFASVVVSDHPVIVQHSRLDSRAPPHALLSTVAYAESGS